MIFLTLSLSWYMNTIMNQVNAYSLFMIHNNSYVHGYCQEQNCMSGYIKHSKKMIYL